MVLAASLFVAALLRRASAGELVIQPCGLYDVSSARSAARRVTLLQYHWEQTTATERARRVAYAKTHVRNYSQENHVCDSRWLEEQASVRLVVTGLTTCPCEVSAQRGKRRDPPRCGHWPLDGSEVRGFLNTTRVFVGDSRMSADARVYLQMLASRCGAPLVFNAGFSHDASPRADFGASCGPLGSSAIFVRNELYDDASRVLSPDALNRSIFSLAGPRPFETFVQVVFGTFVWNLVDFDVKTSEHYLHTAPDSQPEFQSVVSAMRAVVPKSSATSFVLRTSPALDPRPGEEMGPLTGNAPLIQDAHDAWVASELTFAGRHGIALLDAAKLAREYEAALEMAVGRPVPRRDLYVDTMHVCVPLVATWVDVLPYVPRRPLLQ